MEPTKIPVMTSTRRIVFTPSNYSRPQVFTLYNPYEYNITYKMLGTSTQNYSVTPASGSILAGLCKDITLRCKHRSPQGGAKIRIEVEADGDLNYAGISEIEILFAEETQPQKEEEKVVKPRVVEVRTNEPEISPWAYGAAALICAIALFLPTVNDPSSFDSMIPPTFHLTMPQKLVAAYILGIVSVLILRPYRD